MNFPLSLTFPLLYDPERTISLLFSIYSSWFFFCFSSVAQSCPTLCDPMDCSMPGFPVLHYFLEFAQTHVHWVSDAIQPSHPLSPIYHHAFYLSQHQSLFQWVSSSHQVAKVLELQLQPQSFQRTFRVDFLWDGLVGSLCSPRDSRVFSNITVAIERSWDSSSTLRKFSKDLLTFSRSLGAASSWVPAGYVKCINAGDPSWTQLEG